MIGHLLGASGGVEVIACALMLKHGRPAPDDQLRRRPTRTATSTTCRTQPRERRVKRVLSNSFGFGGHNASLALGAV